MSELSVVIQTYNRAVHLRRNLLSLSVQTMPHDQYEALVIDDGSSDDTKRVVDEARQQYDYPIRYLYCHRPQWANPALCWNVGTVRAHSPVIVFMGTDTIAAHDALALLHQYMLDDDGYAFVFGSCYMIHSAMTEALLDCHEATPWLKNIHCLSEHLIAPYHHAAYWHTPLLAAIRKERLEEIRGCDESFTDLWPEDEDLWVRLVAMGVYGVNAPDVWGAHQYHPEHDLHCYRGCSCPLWQKSGTWAHPGAKYDGLPEDIIRNRDHWGEMPEGSYEDRGHAR